MARETSTEKAVRQVRDKLSELLDIVATIPADERRRLLTDAAALDFAPRKTDVSHAKDEIATYLKSREPVLEPIDRAGPWTEEQGRRQAELQHAMFQKLGIAEEVEELGRMKPAGKVRTPERSGRRKKGAS